MTQSLKYAILGAGNMGGALLGGMLKTGVADSNHRLPLSKQRNARMFYATAMEFPRWRAEIARPGPTF